MGNYQFRKPSKASHFKCIASFEWRTSGCNPQSASLEVFDIFEKCFGLSAAFRCVCNWGELSSDLIKNVNQAINFNWISQVITSVLIFRQTIWLRLCQQLNKQEVHTEYSNWGFRQNRVQMNKFQMNPNQNQLLHLLARHTQWCFRTNQLCKWFNDSLIYMVTSFPHDWISLV